MRVFNYHRPIVWVAVATSIFLLAHYFQFGSAGPIPLAYVAVCLASLWFMETRLQMVFMTSFATLLILLGYILTPLSAHSGALLLDHISSIFSIWLATAIAIRFRKASSREAQHTKQLSALFINSTEGILFTDQEGRIIQVNPACEVMFGYGTGEMKGLLVEQLMNHSFTELHRIHRTAFFTHPRNRRMGTGKEFTAQRKDGSEFPVEISLSYFQQENQVVAIAFVMDITERRKAASALQLFTQNLERAVRERTHDLTVALASVEKTNKALEQEIATRKAAEVQLRKSEALYKTMMHNFPDGVIGVINRDLKYIMADGERLEDIGFTVENTPPGDSIFDNHYLSESKVAEADLKRAFSGQKIKFEESLGEKTFLVEGIPLDNGAQIDEVLLVLRDISAQKQSEKNMQKALAKERELNNMKSRFVTMASHEFRTPLTTILSSAFLLDKYKGESFEKVKHNHLDRINRAVNHMTELLNDFLSLGKLEEGKIKPVWEHFLIKSFVEEIVHELQPTARESQQIVYHYAGPDDEVLLDKSLLRRIIVNLLANALKYSGPNGVVHIEVNHKHESLCLKVQDNGIGIPESDQRHIFKRFYRAQNASNIDGTGLGLNISKKYVRLLRGRIAFTSKEGEGSTFVITIPLENSILQKQVTASLS